MLARLLLPLVLLAVPVTVVPSAPAAPTADVGMNVAGDSVIVTVKTVDNATPQPVSVDSVGFYVEIDRGVVGGITDVKTIAVAKIVGTTTGRFAYPLSLWGPNAELHGRVGARYGRTNPEGGATLWSGWTYTSNTGWSYTRDLRAPNAPEAGKVSTQSVGLN